jgi:hypothetical protein
VGCDSALRVRGQPKVAWSPSLVLPSDAKPVNRRGWLSGTALPDAVVCPCPSFRTRPSGSPFGRPSVVISARPKRGEIRNEHAVPQKRRAAAYGVGRDSIAEAPPGDCPVSIFFATSCWSGSLPGEESRTRHVPFERALLDSGVVVKVCAQ